jgi:hypothetical protein
MIHHDISTSLETYTLLVCHGLCHHDTRTSMTPLNTCWIWTTTTMMDLQGLLTLPGYSWRRKRHEGDEGWTPGRVDGYYLGLFTGCWLNSTHAKYPTQPKCQAVLYSHSTHCKQRLPDLLLNAKKLDKKLKFHLKSLLSLWPVVCLLTDSVYLSRLPTSPFCLQLDFVQRLQDHHVKLQVLLNGLLT